MIMIQKDNIIDSWIMVEHLSEGEFKKSKNMYALKDIQGGDYHTYFKNLLMKKDEKSGIVIYGSVFNFKEVVEIMRKWYDLKPTEEEISMRDKFTAAIYFDKDLIFQGTRTFLTASGYIRIKNNRILNGSIQDPQKNFAKFQQEFSEFEKEIKDRLEQKFTETANDKEKFNRTILESGEYFPLDSSYASVLNNVETDGTNLHSFYIDDLEKSKKISTDNLQTYLFGYDGRRMNLDSRTDSVNYDPEIFSRILQPSCYPSGRFPGETKYSLSFMQQAAVNLSVGFDDRKIRSVNGPPGTGKTTLLKDIFAELIVKQAVSVVNMKEKFIKNRYKNIIAELPDEISENEIVVASSNNGAVQNIVNELPLISKIDEELLEELKDREGYFWSLSNKKLSEKWFKENGKDKCELVKEDEDGEDKFWGLFSLEGGRKQNIDNIICKIKHIKKYLAEEYEPDENVYGEFQKQYDLVNGMKKEAQKFADSCNSCQKDRLRLSELRTSFESERKSRENTVGKKIVELGADIEKYGDKIGDSERQLEEFSERKENIKEAQRNVQNCIDALKTKKPGIFSGRAAKEEYSRKMNEFLDQSQRLSEEYMNCSNELIRLKNSIDELKKARITASKQKDSLKNELNAWMDSMNAEMSALEKRVSVSKTSSSGKVFQPLDMSLDHETLQLSNPWFDEEFRIEQSKLFILALCVRKQFLYENRKNLESAFITWNKRNEYVENKRVIAVAWHWINFAIPVISSTFASFSRMCGYLEENTIGHLFVDEAGQALPQAAVGAVFRSKNIMVVGDPAQIKPVLTLDSAALAIIASHFGVNEKYLSASASVQTLVDAASRFGFYRQKDKAEDSWIGIPLWVHRRCMHPMFDIANEISYDNLMVQGIKKYGKTGWFDVGGQADDKYVKKQADFLVKKLSRMIEEDPSIIDKNEKDAVYVITPFSKVADMLSSELKKINFTRYKNNKCTNIGTIHTFQGKEAPIVFMVLGADKQSSGAASWAVGEPNMMNVAATRAKEEFYIIGDKKLYCSLGSDVVDSTVSIIEQYKKKFPELVDDTVTQE